MASKQFNSVDGYSTGNPGSTINVIDAAGNITASGSITRNSRNVPTVVHQANTPPSSPLEGDQWYNTTTGVLFEYLNDSTSSQWVDVNGIPGIIASSLSSTANTVTNNAQPNITSVGTLTSLVMAGNITPSSTNTYSLGNTTNRWDNLWLAGNTIYLGNADIKANATSLILTNPGGGQLVVSGTGIASSNNIYNGNSNVNIATANGNVTIAAVGNATMTISGSGANVTGTFRSTGATVLAASSGNVGIGNVSPGQKLTVAGTVESTSGGFKFPDGTTQNTAAAGGGGGGVTTFSAGSTGFNPGTATNGAVTLSGTLYATSGGTGVSSSPTSGQLLIGTSFGSYNLGTLTAGSGIAITNGSGSITIAATGAGGPTIESFFLTTSSGNFYNNTPNATSSAPLVGYTDSGPSKYGAFFFYNGGSNASVSFATINTMQITDSASGFGNFTSGPDFFASSFNVYGYTAVCYSINLYSTAIQNYFSDSATAISANSFKPVAASSSFSSSNPAISVSASEGSYGNGNGSRGVVVTKFGGSTYLTFGSGDTNPQNTLTVNSISININGGAPTNYNSGSDFTISAALNSADGEFGMLINPINATLTTLLTNSFLGT